jgi:hypothetical protein
MISASAEAAEHSPEQQARSIRPGSKIEVGLLNGQKLNGRLGKISEKEFDLLPRDKGAVTSRSMSFAEVQQIHSKERRTGTRIAIYAGVVFGTLLILGGIVSAAGCC